MELANNDLTNLGPSEFVLRVLKLFTQPDLVRLCLESLVCAVPFLVCRHIGHHYVWQRVALALRPNMSPEVAEKFAKACWHTICYATFWIAAVLLSINEPWGLSFDKGLWAGYPFDKTDTQRLRPLFVVEMGFYFHCTVISMIEIRRSDFAVICAHHVLALLLLCGSFCSNMSHVGTAVLVTLDVADVLLYVAKILHYATDAVLVHAAALAVMATGFFVSRVVLLGQIVYSVWFRVKDVSILSPQIYSQHYQPFHTVLQVMLTLIWAMQIFWFMAIIVVLKDLVIQKRILDPINDHGRDVHRPASPAPQPEKTEKRRNVVRASS